MATIQNTYTGDGSTVLYSFTFPYIESTDVNVSIDGVDTTAFTLANATTVEFTTAPANGAAIRIYRSTQIESVSSSFFPGSTIRAQDLNDNFEQTLFVVQEAVDTVNNSDAAGVLAIANQALSTAQQAESTAAAAETAAQNAVDTAISTGDNVSELTNDANYVSTGDNVSGLVNDAFYLVPGSNINVLNNNSGYITNNVTGDFAVTGTVSTGNIVATGSLNATGSALCNSNITAGGSFYAGSAGGYGWTNDADTFISHTADAIGLTVGGLGNLSVTTTGTTVGGAGITYDGNNYFRILYSNTSGGRFLLQADNGTQHPLCRSFNNNINFRWDGTNIVGNVDGAIEMVVGTTSDYRLKENVVDMDSSWDLVKSLRPVTYDHIGSEGTKHGFIAHEVQEAGLPEGASGEKDGELMQGINTYPIVAALTKALQEAMERIEQLENP